MRNDDVQLGATTVPRRGDKFNVVEHLEDLLSLLVGFAKVDVDVAYECIE